MKVWVIDIEVMKTAKVIGRKLDRKVKFGEIRNPKRIIAIRFI